MDFKLLGYSDEKIAWLLKCKASEVTAYRKGLGIRRTYKLVDTCAAEFEAKTPYYYSTFDTENESIRSDKKKVIVLGSGPNRIGQGIEFDYCCVHGLLALKEMDYEAIMVNCNPETVSTDFDVADKLYFEPVYWEHLEEIIELEQPEGVIVQLGGQTALKLAKTLHEKGIKIIGTSYEALDMAEDRGQFSDLLKELDIPYPKYGIATDADEALDLVACGGVGTDDGLSIDGFNFLRTDNCGGILPNPVPDGYVFRLSVPPGQIVRVNIVSCAAFLMNAGGKLCFRKALPSSIVLASTRNNVVSIDGKCWEYFEDTSEAIDTEYNNAVDEEYYTCEDCADASNSCNSCSPALPDSMYATVSGYQGTMVACACRYVINSSALRLDWVSGCTWRKQRYVMDCGQASYTLSWTGSSWQLVISWPGNIVTGPQTDVLTMSSSNPCNPSGIYSAASYVVCGLTQTPRAVVSL
jgi:hypothetical protein